MNPLTNKMTKRLSQGLDFEFIETGGEWQVWTPDCDAGACIGSGPTEVAAKEDAIRNMEITCETLTGAKV